MKVLVIGSGAREHALVKSLMADPGVTEVVCAPGNAGVALDCTTLSVDIADATAIADLAERLAPDLVVIGPELPLVNGAADAVRERGISCFGPSAAAAQLEGSKAFAKDVMAAAGVPTANSVVCADLAQVESALDRFAAPYVVKDDGLAAGKGVVVTDDRAQALSHARECLGRGAQIVIEEFLSGPEVSLFVITDGVNAVPLLAAQDHKRVGDGDTGANTGGMGAYTPLDWAPADLVERIMDDVARPTLAEMSRRGTPFAGVLYCGLALTPAGLRVVEFNARFGDPEIQAVLRLLDSPLGTVLVAAADGALDSLPPLRWRSGSAVCVVIAAHGYPGDVITGDDIVGIDRADNVPGVQVVHAGTQNRDGRVVTAGGRVLSVTAVGDDLAQALQRAYQGVALIEIRGAHHRTDIGRRAGV